eukprot:Seg593.16 transcript_id=Seg593.16/GoldUCD/mRNA.D3Y31 product=Fibulin-1 protein_id=Seg593.16/GoldUCD/D3Y31
MPMLFLRVLFSIDINECQWATRCEPKRSTCVNTPGNYYCRCRAGFYFLESHGICLDRNECSEKIALCNQRCFNSFGSYRCGCFAGYQLDHDRTTCIDIDECTRKPCDQVCTNTAGSYKCFCRQGYVLDIDEKTCIPNNCKVPRPPPHGKLTLPCDFGYGSTCPVSCNHGYVLRGPDLIKCEIKNGVVFWDMSDIKCEEIRVCKPNPCKFGGKCDIITPTVYSCNCTGTGHSGRNCEVGIISMAAFPKLELRKQAKMTLKANPGTQVELTVHPEDTSITVAQNIMVLTNTKGTAQFSISGTEVGIKSVSYDIGTEELFEIPRQSLVLVYDPVNINQFRIHSLTSLVKDCFALEVTYKKTGCPATKVFATTSWVKRSLGHPNTNGIAVVQIGNLRFPLLIPGTDQSEIFVDSLSRLQYKTIPKQRSCRKKKLTPGQLQYIGKMDIFAKNFISEFNKLIPPWFQLEINDILKTFSENMVRSLIMSGEKVKAQKSCSSLAIDGSSTFLVFLHQESLVLKIREKRLHMKTNEAFCLAVDMCKREAHIQLPDKYGADLVNMMSFQELLSLGWKLKIKAVGFGTSSGSDARKCLRGKATGETRVLFGEANMEYSNKHGVKAIVSGDMAIGVKTRDGQEVVDLSDACIDGHSLIESPSWKATDLKENVYQRNIADYTNIVKMKEDSPSAEKSIMSILQQDGSVFKVKTGLRPIIKKSSRSIKIDMNYKVTAKSSAKATDSNFNKYTNIDSLSYSVMDVEAGIEMLAVPRYLTGKLSQIKRDMKTWSEKLSTDIVQLMDNVDNTKLVNDKVKEHYYKGKKFYDSIRDLVIPIKSSLDSSSFETIQTGLSDMNVVLLDLSKDITKTVVEKKFEAVTVQFNGSMCLFKPCIPDTSVKIYPQSVENPWEGYCYDPSKTSFQMWDTKAKMLLGQNVGKLFTFTKDDEFYLCMSIFGVNKGKFDGTLNILGNSLKSKFRLHEKKIHFDTFDMKLSGKYSFRINGSIDASLRRWNMLSVTVHGTAGTHSAIVREMQASMDDVASEYYHRLKMRQKDLKSKDLSLKTKNGLLRAKLSHDQRGMRKAQRDYTKAKNVYMKSKRTYDEMLRMFAERRRDYQLLKQQLNTICRITKCSLECFKFNNCKVCQKRIFGKHSIPKCRMEYRNKSYSYKDSYEGRCSHIVEDRLLKYTGNCKNPPFEKHAMNKTIERINKKIKNNEILTLEDAWDLKLYNETAGNLLEKQVKKQNFFRAFPDRFKEGRLSEEHLEQLEEYTNTTFAKKIRRESKKVKLWLIMKELDSKKLNGEDLSKVDFDRVRKFNATLAELLEKDQALKKITVKLEFGKELGKDELNLLKEVNPEFHRNLTIAKERGRNKELYDSVREKLRKGSITKADLDELEIVDPTTAKKIKEALKEQLKKKFNEMKSKLSSVDSAIKAGYGGKKLSSLNEKLKSLTKKQKPFDRRELIKIQNRIKNSVASSRSIFEKMLERFELALEIQNVTGSTADFHRSLNAFFSSLEKFNLEAIFTDSQNHIAEQLEDLQKWFETVVKFIDNLCAKCGKNCDSGNVIRKVLEEIRNSIAKFEKRFCKRKSKFDAKKVCEFAKKISRFVQRYDMTKLRDCNAIKKVLVKNLNLIVDALKGIRKDNAIVFENIWKKSKIAKGIKSSYIALVTEFKSMLRFIPGSIKFPSPEFNVISDGIIKKLRPGKFNLRDTEYIAATEAILAFAQAIRLIPVNVKAVASKRVSISANVKERLMHNFQRLVKMLPEAYSNLCPTVKNAKSTDQNPIKRLAEFLEAANHEFKEILDAPDLPKLFVTSQKLGTLLENVLRLADKLKNDAKDCLKKRKSPLDELAKFLKNVQNFKMKTVKDISAGIRTTLEGIGEGIKAPIGKLMNQFEKIAIHMPAFDIPIMIMMNPKSTKLALVAFQGYLDMISNIFGKLVKIASRCKNCKIEEVFGEQNLKSVAEKLDQKMKPISKKIEKFSLKVKSGAKGLPLLFIALEQIKTNLQRIYKSGSELDKTLIEDIVKGIKNAKEAVKLIEEGKFNIYLNVGGAKDDEIFEIVKELSKVRKHVLELYEKTKDPTKKLEELYAKIKRVLSKIPSVTNKIEDFDKGAIETRLDLIQDIGKIVKDITNELPSFYKTSKDGQKFLEQIWIPKLSKSLDKIEEAKTTLIKKTEGLLIEFGLFGSEKDAIKFKDGVQRLRGRKYSALYGQLNRVASGRRLQKIQHIARRAQRDESFTARIVTYWKGIYQNVVGKIDRVKTKVLQLRVKFDKYMKLYKDIKNTVEEIKKGPMSEIGQLKDSLEGLVSSVDGFDFKKIVMSEPEIVRNKLSELKDLFLMTKNVLKKTDGMIRKCKSCSVENTLGYRFVKDLGAKIERKFATYYEFGENFADKFADGALEVQNVTRAAGSLRDRFAGVFKKGQQRSESLLNLADALDGSSYDIDQIQNSIEDVTGILLNKDVDLQVIRGTYDGLVNQLQAVVTKSAEISGNIEKAYNEVKRFGKTVDLVDEKASKLKSGPLSTRIAVAEDISRGVKTMLNVLPEILGSSKRALDSAGVDVKWVDKFQSGLGTLTSRLDKTLLKTDSVLDAAGILVEGKRNISKEIAGMKEGINDIKNAPWERKLDVIRNVAGRTNGAIDTALGTIVSSSNALGLALSKEGLVQATHEVIGKRRIAKYGKLMIDVTTILHELQKGPINNIGKLTDSVELFTDGLQDFDIGQALLSDTTSLKEKIGEFQQLADSAGDILVSISNITGLCKTCNMDKLLGKEFSKKIASKIQTTFNKLHTKVEDISKRVNTGKTGVQGFLKTAKGISKSFDKVVEGGKFTPDTFKRAAEELKNSAANLQSLKDSSSSIFSAIFNEDNDIHKIQTKFEGIVDRFSGLMNKSAKLSDKVEKSYQTVGDIRNTVASISNDLDKFDKGPIEARTEIARKMAAGVKEIIHSLPTLMNQSAAVVGAVGINVSLMNSFGTDLVKFSKDLDTVFEKTDSVLKSVGVIGGNTENIAKASGELSKDFQKMLDAPIHEKVAMFKKMIGKVDQLFDEGIKTAKIVETTVKDLTGVELKVSGGLGKIGASLGGFMQNVSNDIDFVEDVYKDVTGTIEDISSGPVAKVGALTDSFKGFVDSLKNYNLAELLVMSPKFAKEKITDIKEIIKDSGGIIGGIGNLIKKHCKDCNLDDIFGSEFMLKIQKGLKTGLDNVTGKVTTVLDRVEEGGEGILGIVNSVNGIQNGLKALDGIEFNAEGIKKFSNFLDSTSGIIGTIGGDSSKVFGALFQENQDLLKLTGKFEGLVKFSNGLLNKAGKTVDKLSGAMENVEEIKSSFDSVRKGFDEVGSGPLDARIKAVQNIADGLNKLTSGVPDLIDGLSKDSKLSGFLRNFGSQMRDVTSGLDKVIDKTRLIAGDIGGTVESVNNIGIFAGQISNSFNDILKSPLSGKLNAAKNMVNQITAMTNEVNKVTGGISKVVERVTGKTILSSSIFGDTTTKTLNSISNAVNLVADRYEKFQSLTKSVSNAFQSISSDPIDFALNDMPKLLTEAGDVITTLIGDTKSIAGKLGLQLGDINLDPGLVSAAKEFYGFAQGTLGTIQSGKELFTGFNNLLNSKNFKDGMMNFQKLVKSGGKFIENLDDLGGLLFKGDWKNMKDGFQGTLNKITQLVGIDLKKTGEMFGKVVGVAGDAFSIINDVQSLFKIKELNLETGIKLAQSVVGIAQKTVNLLNKFGADIATKGLKSTANVLGTVMAVYNIGKGIFDFIKWMNDACDITYETDLRKKELRYACMKGKISIDVTTIPIEKCEYIVKNVTRGFGKPSFCCEGNKCLYVQNPNCLKKNAACLKSRLQFVDRTASIANRDLSVAYKQFENARMFMDIAQVDMRAAEFLRQRYEVSFNVSRGNLRLNRLEALRASKDLKTIQRVVVSLRRAVDEYSNTSTIRFIRAEFSKVLYSPSLELIPLKVIIRDQNGSYKIVRFMMDFRNVKTSLKMATTYLLRTLTRLKFFSRRRRAIEDQTRRSNRRGYSSRGQSSRGQSGRGQTERGQNDESQGLESAKATKCAQFNDLCGAMTEIIQALADSTSSYESHRRSRRLRTTKSIKMSKSPLVARRQLIKEVLLLQKSTDKNLRSIVKDWEENFEVLIRAVTKQDCSDFKGCIELWVENVAELIDTSVSHYELILRKVRDVSKALGSIIQRRSIHRHTINSKLRKAKKLIKKLRKDVSLCVQAPSLLGRFKSTAFAYIGEEFTLDCKVESNTEVSYMWHLNRTALPAYRDGILRIPDVSFEDEGSYHCQATNAGGVFETDAIVVSVKERIKFLEPLADIAIPRQQPHAVFLTCNTSAPNDATYSWWYQSFAGGIRKLRRASALLNLGMARMARNGIYWCEVDDGGLKLRSRKAVVALVNSKKKSHCVRLDIQGATKGSGCHNSAALSELAMKLNDVIRKDFYVDDFTTGMNVQYKHIGSRKNDGKFFVELRFNPTREATYDDMDLAATDAQMQFDVQRAVKGFLSSQEEFAVDLKSGSCNYLLKTPMTNITWNPEEFNCPPGMGLSKNKLRCLTCLPGSFDNGMSQCRHCPVGSYQPRFGATKCTPCGAGQLTANTGSFDKFACIKSEFKCFEKINIMLALDTSHDLGQGNLLEMKKFARYFIKHFSPSRNSNAQISITTFDNTARLKTSFKGENTLQNLEQAIDRIGLSESTMRTDLFLDLAASVFEEDLTGEYQRNVLLITTNGPITSRNLQEKIDKLKDLGVEVFFSGIGKKFSQRDAVVMSSSPKESHIFKMADFSELTSASTSIAHTVCNTNYG